MFHILGFSLGVMSTIKVCPNSTINSLSLGVLSFHSEEIARTNIELIIQSSTEKPPILESMGRE